MRLTRDKVSEQYEQRKRVFEQRIPSNYYEIILRGELTYPITEYEGVWLTSIFLKKDPDTDTFIENILNIYKPVNSIQDVQNQFIKLQELFLNFEELYCTKYNILPQEFSLFFVTEDRQTMISECNYYEPITRPFHLFITYNDNGKLYSVDKD